MNGIFEEDFKYILFQKLPWNKLANKTILISGANGFLSSYIIETILYLNNHTSQKTKIIGIARNKEKAKKRFYYYKNRQDFEIVIQDICDPIKLKEKVHFIIHAASQASPKYYNIDPVGTLKANVLGTYNLLEFARRNPVESFLFISAGEVYGNIETSQPTNETSYGYLDPATIRSCYAESKRIGETMCVSWHHQYQVPTKIVRLYHTYGPGVRLDDGRVFADFVSNILNNENIIMKSEGKTIRSFCYSADAIAGFFTVLCKGKNGEAYNLANDKAIVSIKRLTEILVNLFPKKKLKVISSKRSKKDRYSESRIQVNNPDISKIKTLGWKPYYSIEEGFLRTIRSFTAEDSS